MVTSTAFATRFGGSVFPEIPWSVCPETWGQFAPKWCGLFHQNLQANGYAVWYTPPQEVSLFFIDKLDIPSGRFKIPAMVWKANAERLAVYTVKGKSKPTVQTPLCHAPYLNVYHSGQVCMGTVHIAISKSECLEDFISRWEQYFFNSYFSHSISGNNSTKNNTTELWRSLAGTGNEFPQDELLKIGYTIKNIIE
jgi:PRTRC genetic system protein B